MIEDEMKTDILFREELFKSTALSPEKTLEELRKIEKIPTYVAFVNKGVQIPSIQESNYKIQDVLVEGKVNSDIRKAMFETSPPFIYVYSRMREPIKWFFTPHPERLQEIEIEEKEREKIEMFEEERRKKENEAHEDYVPEEKPPKKTVQELFKAEEEARKEKEAKLPENQQFMKLYNEKTLSEVRERYGISPVLLFADSNMNPIDMDQEVNTLINQALNIIEFFPKIYGLALVNVVAPEYAKLPFKLYVNRNYVKDVTPKNYDQTLQDFRKQIELHDQDKFINKFGEPCLYEDENRVFDAICFLETEQQIHVKRLEKNENAKVTDNNNTKRD